MKVECDKTFKPIVIKLESVGETQRFLQLLSFAHAQLEIEHEHALNGNLSLSTPELVHMLSELRSTLHNNLKEFENDTRQQHPANGSDRLGKDKGN